MAHRGSTVWIKKTPSYLYHLDYITQQIDPVKFIHIIRAGKDAVASLYDVRKTYPQQWRNEPASVELSVDRWIKDVSISLRYASSPNHILVSYESLVVGLQPTLKRLCQFIGVDFTPDMMEGYAATAQQVSLAREPWKAGVVQPIYNANSTKFYDLFTPEQQAYIIKRTEAIDLSAIDRPKMQSISKPFPLAA